MKSRWIILSCGIVCLAACDSGKKASSGAKAAKAKPVPVHFLIEAEIRGTAGEKIEDAHASSSFYVKRQSGDFQAVNVCDVPSSEKALTVWIRRKGGPVQMVLSNKGEQKEQQDSPWIEDVEEQFVWTSCGEIDPGGEGRELIFIGNDDKTQSVSIDCILFSAGPMEDKDALLTPLPPVSIDPAKITGGYRSAPALWGINLFSGSDPKAISDPGYIENMAYLAPSLVRIYNAGKLEDSGKSSHGLLDFKSRTWDEQKVRLAITGLLDLKISGEIVINIPNWPEWMDADKDGFLDDGKAADYVALVARFAEIVWEFPAARERVLFEITNELDIIYHADLVAAKQPHRIAELASIYVQSSMRIREVAPGVRIGGPSIANSYDTGFHEQFIAYTAPQLDFYSIHMYVSGDSNETDSRILSRADAATQPVEVIKAILAKNSKGREIPVSVNEYNIAGNNESKEPRMTNGFGAVWDAWFLMRLFSAGVDSAAAWTENDEIHGKFSPDGERRPASHLYHILNTEFTGPIARLEIEEPEHIAALTTESGTRLLISHRGLRARKITLPEGKWTGWMIGKDMDVQQQIKAEGEMDLPGLSLLYLEK